MGQEVHCFHSDGTCHTMTVSTYDIKSKGGRNQMGETYVILSDPPPVPVRVPKDAFDRLEAAFEAHRPHAVAIMHVHPTTAAVLAAARALVDAVRGDAYKGCTCDPGPEGQHQLDRCTGGDA